jgi:hypothetical protein
MFQLSNSAIEINNIYRSIDKELIRFGNQKADLWKKCEENAKVWELIGNYPGLNVAV